MEKKIKQNRKFLRFPNNQEEYNKIVPESDEKKKLPFPLFQKPYPSDTALIDLPSPKNFNIGKVSFIDLVNTRISRRRFSNENLSLEELSFLLWCTQGVKEKPTKMAGILRTVPSSGAKSPFETYLFINRVEGLSPGLYRYISFEHKLMFIKTVDNQEEVIGELVYGQFWAGKGAVVFCWVAVPYRTEWRYTILAHKFITLDLGYVSENLYLAAEALKMGTCAIGYYQQKKMDILFELDTNQEMTILIQPVGKVATAIRLKDFFEKKQSPVNEADLQKLVGYYILGENLQVELKLIEGKLTALYEDKQSEMRARNPTEFLGNGFIRAAKFKLEENNSVGKLIVLLSGDTIIDLIKK
jgi:SagB-type dehydrogenase family enzyme